MIRRSQLVWGLGILLVVMSGPVWAQTFNGAITGVVKDQSGAVVPDVALTLRNNATDQTVGTAVSGAEGEYAFRNLAPAKYTIEAVKAGSRARVGAANYLATFLLFAKAAGIKHVLLGCDQLEDFAATSTTKQKRTVETERFRDYVLELQPMADMLSTVVTLHPRAAQAIGEM